MLASEAAATSAGKGEAAVHDVRQSIKMTNFSIAAIMNSSKKVAEAAAAAAAAVDTVAAASRNPFLERPIPFKLEPFSPLGRKVEEIVSVACLCDFFHLRRNYTTNCL